MKRQNKRYSLYGLAWSIESKKYLARHPRCVMCAELGIQTKAVVVDHIKPVKDNIELFWNPNNWQSLCNFHHNSSKRKEENQGYSGACNAKGEPLNARKEWYS